MSSTESGLGFKLVAKEWTDSWFGDKHLGATVAIRYDDHPILGDYDIGTVHNPGEPELASFFPKKDTELDLTELESLVKYMRTRECDIRESL